MQIQSFFGNVPAYRILRDLGVPVQDRDEALVIPHPKHPSARIWVYDQAFVSDWDQDQDFVAGNVYDYLKLVLGSYGAAVDHMLKTYKDIAMHVDGQTPDVHRTEFVSALELGRVLFAGWKTARLNLKARAEKYQPVCQWLHRRHLNTGPASDFLVAVTGVELKSWIGHVGGDVTYPADFYLALPYFSEWHILSRVDIIAIETDKSTSIEINPARHSFFGLQTVRPNCKDVFTFHDVWDLLKYYETKCATGNIRFGAVMPAFNSQCESTPRTLPTGTYVYIGQPDISRAARARSAFKQFFMRADAAPAAQPWMTFALDYVQQTIMREGDLNHRVQRVLDEFKPDPEVGQAMVKWMQSVNRPDLARRMQQHVTSDMRMNVAGYDVEDRLTGYYMQKNGTTAVKQMSNFTLRFTHCTKFRKTVSNFFYGTLLAEGIEIPVVISHKAIGSANILMTEIGVAIHAHLERTVFMPDLYGSDARRQMIHYLRVKVNSLPTRYGLDQLGWDEHRTTFTTPSWTVTSAEIAKNSSAPHPSNLMLQDYYDFNDYDTVAKYDLVTSEICSVIARVVSMLARNFFKLSFPLTVYNNNDTGIKVLSAIFKAFGQKRCFMLNVNDRRDSSMTVPDVSDYPVYGECRNSQFLAGRTGYIAVLDPTGETLSAAVDNAVYRQIFSMCEQIFPQVCLGLLRYSAEIQSMLIPNPSRKADFILEGQRIVERFTNFKQFLVFVDDLPNLRMMLANIPVSQLFKFFAEDPVAEVVRINFRSLDSVYRNAVFKELFKQDERTTLHKLHYITVPTGLISEMLCRYYGQPITLETIEPEDRSGMPVQETLVVQSDCSELSQTESPTLVRRPETATGTSQVIPSAPKVRS